MSRSTLALPGRPHGQTWQRLARGFGTTRGADVPERHGGLSPVSTSRDVAGQLRARVELPSRRPCQASSPRLRAGARPTGSARGARNGTASAPGASAGKADRPMRRASRRSRTSSTPAASRMHRHAGRPGGRRTSPRPDRGRRRPCRMRCHRARPAEARAGPGSAGRGECQQRRGAGRQDPGPPARPTPRGPRQSDQQPGRTGAGSAAATTPTTGPTLSPKRGEAGSRGGGRGAAFWSQAPSLVRNGPGRVRYIGRTGPTSRPPGGRAAQGASPQRPSATIASRKASPRSVSA